VQLIAFRNITGKTFCNHNHNHDQYRRLVLHRSITTYHSVVITRRKWT